MQAAISGLTPGRASRPVEIEDVIAVYYLRDDELTPSTDPSFASVDYQVLRLDRMPQIEVHIVPSTEPPTGVGEPGTPVVAPAVANALHDVTGRRYHKLPLSIDS